MKAFALIVSILQFALLVCSGSTRDCDTCVQMRFVGENTAAPPIMIGSRAWHPEIFVIRKARIGTLQQFEKVVSSLPRGTEIIWDSGCIAWDGLPIVGGPFPFPDIQAICAKYGVKFTHVVSGY